MNDTDVRDAIGPMQEALRADGADVHVVGVDGGTVDLRLLVEDATCAECVMPQEVLEELLREAIVAAGHPVERVRLEDPRVS